MIPGTQQCPAMGRGMGAVLRGATMFSQGRSLTTRSRINQNFAHRIACGGFQRRRGLPADGGIRKSRPLAQSLWRRKVEQPDLPRWNRVLDCNGNRIIHFSPLHTPNHPLQRRSGSHILRRRTPLQIALRSLDESRERHGLDILNARQYTQYYLRYAQKRGVSCPTHMMQPQIA